MKTCLICQVAQPLSAFAPNRTGREGLHPWCRECVREYGRSKYANGKAARPSTRKSAAFIAEHTPSSKDAMPGFRMAEQVWRRLKKKNRIPPWVKFEDILPIYEAAARAKCFVVDHIVPLHGKLVSGLHVAWNLQLLTPVENSRKHAKHVI